MVTVGLCVCVCVCVLNVISADYDALTISMDNMDLSMFETALIFVPVPIVFMWT